MSTSHASLVIAAGLAVASLALVPPCASLAQEEFAACEGFYRLPAGELVHVGRRGMVEETARPYFLDWQTGRTDYLKPAGVDTFTGGSVGEPPAPRTTILFHREGEAVTGLTIREDGLPERRAGRVRLDAAREVTFANGEVSLLGRLRVPLGEGPFPAVVLVHGSGPGTRAQVSLMEWFFLRLGLAVLSYDKRGCGGSSGDWRQVDLEELADDAIAGVRWLRSLPEIDPERVGLWGISQGGWIGPLAAARAPGEVAFVLNSSGPATSLRRQDTHMMANELRMKGFAETEVARVVRGMHLLYDFARGKAPAESLDAAMEEARADPRLAPLALPPARELRPDSLYARQKYGDAAWFFHLDPDRDGIAPYRTLRCPVLVTYGRLDYTVPYEESAALLAEVEADRPDLDLTVEIIPDAGHGFLQMDEQAPAKPRQPMLVSRAWFDAMEGWLRARGFAGPQPVTP